MDFSKPQFQNSHLAQVTGLTSDTLQTWANRGLLTSSTPGRVGSGQRRLYSAADVIHVRLIQKLMAFGLPVSVASEICSARLNDETVEFIYQLHSQFNDKILMCISRTSSGYKAEYVNMSRGQAVSLEGAAASVLEPGRPEDSPVVRACEALATAVTQRGAALTVNLGELIGETIETLGTVVTDAI